MKIFYGFKSFLKSGGSRKRLALTIGVFDGVHRGHKKIIGVLKNKAKRRNLGTLLITFDPHPADILSFKKTPLLISLKHRLRLLGDLGLDYVIVLGFDRRFAKVTAPDFLKNIVGRIPADEIVVGDNFFFGRDKKGTFADLKRFSQNYRYKVSVVKALKSFGRAISSTWVRRLIMKGDLKKASKLLSRPVTLLGTVSEGKKRGRIMGFPTANINPHHEAIPPSGVYAVRITLKNKSYKGILNIGIRPTFAEKVFPEPEPTIEVHIFNFNGSIYGEDLEITFIERIRNERRFDSVENLKNGISKDVKRAMRILRG